ncbi:MAG: protein kinase [Gemmataceae bacterium]
MQGRVFLGRYETVRLIGEGGMGRVYLANQTDLGRQVVVKVMHDHIAADPTFRERFERETLLTARFQHPYAVTVYDATLNDPQGPCIVMEYIRGVTMDTVLANNRRLDPKRVGRLLYMLCEVLYAAHQQGIIHRDLKPANLMVVDPDTPYEIIKVMDFGLAKCLGANATAQVTNHEFAVGTPGYMCPEQARGDEIDHRGDLYSVGVILFELLTGQLPFAGRSTMEVLIAHATEEPPSFSAVGLVGIVPQPIERVVRACLAKNPDDRPANARVLAEMYRDALNEVQLQESGMGSAGGAASGGSRFPRPRPIRSSQQGPPSHPIRSNSNNVNLSEEESLPEAPIAPAVRPMAPVVPAGPMPPAPVLVSEPVRVKSQTPAPAAEPNAIVQYLEAWMPEKIATFKLRGFIQDNGGALVECVPGRIVVRMGGKNCVYKMPSNGLSWLGLSKSPVVEIELRLHRGDAGRDNHLRIAVTFRSTTGTDLNADPRWRAICLQIFVDLRGYLMGQNAALNSTVS